MPGWAWWVLAIVGFWTFCIVLAVKYPQGWEFYRSESTHTIRETRLAQDDRVGESE